MDFGRKSLAELLLYYHKSDAIYSTTVLRNMYVLYMFVALPILKHKITFEKFDMCFKGTIHIMKQS